MHRHHHGPGRCGHFGRRRYPTSDELLRALEEHQRDLEQETADIADMIRRLREEKTKATATV